MSHQSFTDIVNHCYHLTTKEQLMRQQAEEDARKTKIRTGFFTTALRRG